MENFWRECAGGHEHMPAMLARHELRSHGSQGSQRSIHRHGFIHDSRVGGRPQAEEAERYPYANNPYRRCSCGVKWRVVRSNPCGRPPCSHAHSSSAAR